MVIAPDSKFAERVLKESGQSVNLCYQCRKCASGCPVVYEMDYTPTQIIHAIRLGMKDLVLKSKTIWLCASCETCTTRCPQDVDIAKVMDAARQIAIREKVKPQVGDIPAFNKSFLQMVRIFGRSFDLGLTMLLKLRTREFTKDMDLGVKLLRKGKLKLFPSFTRIIETNKIFSKVSKMEKEGK